MNHTVRRLLLRAAYTIGGIGLALAADSAAHAADSPPAVVTEHPGGVLGDVADKAKDTVDQVLPEPEPSKEPAKDEPKDEKPADEGPPQDDKPADPPKNPVDAPSQDETEEEPADSDDEQPAPPTTEDPTTAPVDPAPVGGIVDGIKDKVQDVTDGAEQVVEDVTEPLPTPAVPSLPVVTTPAPAKPTPPADEPTHTEPAEPAPAPPAKPAPAAALPVTIGPVAATGVTLDGTPTPAIDDVPATTGVLEVPLCGDNPTAPTQRYPRGAVRQIRDAATGQPVTVPADPPAKPCPSKPVGPDATPAPNVKPPTTNGVDLLAFVRDKALHHPTPPLLHHIWPRAWIPATRGEHIEPRPA